jgi:hypothetical protein
MSVLLRLRGCVRAPRALVVWPRSQPRAAAWTRPTIPLPLGQQWRRFGGSEAHAAAAAAAPPEQQSKKERSSEREWLAKNAVSLLALLATCGLGLWGYNVSKQLNREISALRQPQLPLTHV